MKDVIRWANILSLVLVILSYTGSVHAQVSTGALRVLIASPDTSAVNLFINDKKVFSDLKYRGLSSYSTVPGGSYTIKVAATGGSSTQPEINLPTYQINGGSKTTLVVLGLAKNNSLSILPLADETQPAPPNKALIRFVHTSPDAPAVDINAEGLGNVFSNVSFKNAAKYILAPAGSVKLSASPANTTNAVLTKSITLTGGKAYTVYAVGELRNNSLDTVIAVDNDPQSMPATGGGWVDLTDSNNRGLVLVGLGFVMVTSFILYRKRLRGHNAAR